MRHHRTQLLVLVLLLAGATVLVAAKRGGVGPEHYRGLGPEESAAALLAQAAPLADGSWETIALAQIHLLSGDDAEAERLFDSIKKKEGSEWIRIGRVYYRAGDWDRARDAFERVVASDPDDADWLAEIGMYYNLQGDRERAEELFDRSFELEPRALYNVLKAAGSYVGVEER